MNGIIIINKPKDYTSHDIVAILRKTLGIKKIGHTGTLDPNATGVLPLLIGDGTKISKYLIDHDKEYEVVLKLGVKTDSADGEGRIIKEDKNINKTKIKEEKIKEVLKSFIGKQEQIPPIYSAIKVNGKKLYEYARSGQNIDIKPRNIEIYNMELISINEEEKEISYKVACSKGTYIRSLCENIASKIGTVGYMKELNRTKVGSFTIEDSVNLKEIQDIFKNTEKIKKEYNLEEIKFIKQNIITIESFFKNKNKIKLNNNELTQFLNGVKLYKEKEDDVYNIYDANEKYIGLGVIENSLLKRDVILI